MNLFLQMLQEKQVSVEERRRETVFLISFRTNINEDLNIDLKKISKNSLEQREFAKFKKSNPSPTLLFPHM